MVVAKWTKGLIPLCFAFGIKTVKLCSKRHADRRAYSHKKSSLVLRKLEISPLPPGSLLLPLWHFPPSYFALLHDDKKCKSRHLLSLKMSLIQIIIQHLLQKGWPVSLHKSACCHGNQIFLLLEVPTWFWIRCNVVQIRRRETICFIFGSLFESKNH